MTKKEFYRQMAAESGLAPANCRAAWEAGLGLLTRIMQDRDHVRFGGFANFCTKHRARKPSYDFQNDRHILLPERDMPMMKPEKALIDKINGSTD